MKVGYKTQNETQFQSITIPDMDISPVLVSVVQGKDNNMDNKFLVWHIEGGLGKNIAATALLPDIAKQYKTRKIVVVASYPEVFLNHPDVYRVYRVGMTAYFYEDYILNKDTLVFRHEPYFQTGHILKQKHLVENWAELLGVSYKKQLPNLHLNMMQKKLPNIWQRQKPILLIQTNGGLFQGQALDYAWTRDMPIELANYIVDKIGKDYHVIQITRENSPQIPGAEIVNYPMSNMELFGLVAASEKRFLIDSCLQHAAAALNLPSTIFWVGTAPENFGYEMHTNIKALPPKGQTKMIDSYLFDYSFDGQLHECPYQDLSEMFDMNAIDKNLV
jgi:hypothetical protein